MVLRPSGLVWGRCERVGTCGLKRRWDLYKAEQVVLEGLWKGSTAMKVLTVKAVLTWPQGEARTWTRRRSSSILSMA